MFDMFHNVLLHIFHKILLDSVLWKYWQLYCILGPEEQAPMPLVYSAALMSLIVIQGSIAVSVVKSAGQHFWWRHLAPWWRQGPSQWRTVLPVYRSMTTRDNLMRFPNLKANWVVLLDISELKNVCSWWSDKIRRKKGRWISWFKIIAEMHNKSLWTFSDLKRQLSDKNKWLK